MYLTEDFNLTEEAEEFLLNNVVIIGKRVLQDVMDSGEVVEEEL